MPSADAVLFAQISEVNSYYSMLDYIMKVTSLTSYSSVDVMQIRGYLPHTKIKVTLKSTLNELKRESGVQMAGNGKKNTPV